MGLRCIHCSELVEATVTRCLACGGDPAAGGDSDLIDLRDGDDRERANTDLLATLVAAYSEAAPHKRPHWGENASTPLELELEPIRMGRGKHLAAAADVLPARPPRRPWRRS